MASGRIAEAAEFADRVLGRLADGPDKFDIAMIMMIIDAIMAIIQDCPQPQRVMKAYHRGVKKNRWYWTWRAKSQVRQAGDCDDNVAAAIVEEFGELSASTVADLA